MENLHEDIRSVIVSHAPPESVLKFKLVSKTWKNYLCDQKVGLLFLMSEHGDRNLQLYYGDYDDIPSRHYCSTSNEHHENFWHRTLEKINHPGINKRDSYFVDYIVGSCNGLVCIPHHFVDDPVYICNPLTTEYVSLPRLNTKYGLIVSGFGYDVSSNKYKVIRIHYTDRANYDDPVITKGFVQVYTLGSGTGWRDIGEIPYSLFRPGTFAHGSLYWFDREKKKILGFNLADEQFRWLPTVPPCFNGDAKDVIYQIKVLGGDLCLVHIQLGEHVDLWSFKKKNCDDDGAKGTYHSWVWSLEFSIACLTSDRVLYNPFAVTKNNQVLLWLNSTSLLGYDKESDTLTHIVDDDRSFAHFQGIPHMNSLVSLKALGEKTKRKIDKKCSRKKLEENQSNMSDT